jgi:hypothetical protein
MLGIKVVSRQDGTICLLSEDRVKSSFFRLGLNEANQGAIEGTTRNSLNFLMSEYYFLPPNYTFVTLISVE